MTNEVKSASEVATTEATTAATNINEACPDPNVTAAIVAAACLRTRAQIKTVRLDPRDLKPSWPVAIATLEQLSGWAVFALRLGTLALIQECVRELSQRDARADLVVDLRQLIEALAHMPLEA
jgi:hypothetical protein